MPPAPRKSRKKVLVALVVVVVLLVVLVIAATLPVSKGSGTGSFQMQPDGPGYGIGWQTVNLSASGQVSFSWSLTSAKGQAGVAVFGGTCLTALSCSEDAGNASYCFSPPGSNVELIGATSGTCTADMPGGTVTIVAAEISGYGSGDKISYTYTISAPLV